MSLPSRIRRLEDVLASNQPPPPWRSWVQETDDPSGWYRDRHSGERRHWLSLAHGEDRGTITRVFFDPAGVPTTEHLNAGVVREYPGLDLRQP